MSGWHCRKRLLEALWQPPFRKGTSRTENTTAMAKIVNDYTLRGFLNCDPAGLLRSPKTPESRKYQKAYKNPDPRLTPEIRQQTTKTAQKFSILVPFSYFSVFFHIFGGQPEWGFSYFFCIFGIPGFSGSVAGPQDRKSRRL